MGLSMDKTGYVDNDTCFRPKFVPSNGNIMNICIVYEMHLCFIPEHI